MKNLPTTHAHTCALFSRASLLGANICPYENMQHHPLREEVGNAAHTCRGELHSPAVLSLRAEAKQSRRDCRVAVLLAMTSPGECCFVIPRNPSRRWCSRGGCAGMSALHFYIMKTAMENIVRPTVRSRVRHLQVTA